MSKRFVDLFLSLLGILVLSPVMLVIAVIIKTDSNGPVFFRQPRIGRLGQSFVLLKFRTMVVDADTCGPSITVSNDERITNVGRFLRTSKLDELPQLLNVIKGEMSLVGPRPELSEFVASYPSDLKEKILSMRPGITDNASIEFRNESEMLDRSADPIRCYKEEVLPAKLALYKEYVEHHTIGGDLTIILKTIQALVSRSS